MAILTGQQKTTLLQLLTSAGLQAVEPYGAANQLNAPTSIPNTPIPQIDVPMSWDAIKDGLEAATISKLDSSAALGTFIAAVNTQGRTQANGIIAWWLKGNVITQAEHDTLYGLANRKQDDPTWPATKAGPSLWAAAFPGFTYVLDGNDYDRCTAAVIIEARS